MKGIHAHGAGSLARGGGGLLMARIPEAAVHADPGRGVVVPAVGAAEFECLATAYWAWRFDALDRPPMLSLHYY